jgi:hypothetical protein
MACAIGHIARADYLFTWEGNSNSFHASFEVTDAEAAPGQNYYPSTYPLSLTNSVTISSPDGSVFRWGYASATQGQDLFGLVGSGPPIDFSINLFEPPFGPWSAVAVNASPHEIEELAWLPGASSPVALYDEGGQWNVTNIPEPSAAVLLALGAIAYWTKKRRVLPAEAA